MLRSNPNPKAKGVVGLIDISLIPLRSLIGIFLGLLLCIIPISANADPLSQSFSTWRVNQDQIQLSFVVPESAVKTLLTKSYDTRRLGDDLSRYLTQNIKLSAEAVPCKVVIPPQSQRARKGYVRISAQYQCPQNTDAMTINNSAFFNEIPTHLHIAKISQSDHPLFEKIFTAGQQTQKIELNNAEPRTEQGALEIVLVYFSLGFEHILAGLDHIAFLATLLLLGGRLRNIILLVTGFTLGHSLTLTLATLNIIAVKVPLVESLIGFSIAIVAIENVMVKTASTQRIAPYMGVGLLAVALVLGWIGRLDVALVMMGLALFSVCYLKLSTTQAKAQDLRPWLTGGFGLIHGFGFATVLAEANLPDAHILSALLGFNAGVEAGQIMLVMLMVLAGMAFRRLMPTAAFSAAGVLASSVLCSIGIYWFLQRMLMAI